MLRAILVGMVLVGLFTPITARADHEQDVHAAAHLGISYAITMISYGAFERVFRADPTVAFIFAAFTAGTIGLTYKMMEPPGPNLSKAMLQNGAGILAAGASVVMFSW